MNKKVFISIVSTIFIILVITFIYISSKNNFFSEVDSTTYQDLYIDVSSDEIYIYVRDKDDKYIGYQMIHEKKGFDPDETASNYDTWNLEGASQFTRNKYGAFKKDMQIATYGEWELAIREENANDFVGGDAHGDEINTAFNVYVDEEKINLENKNGYEANHINIVSESDLYRDNTIAKDLEVFGKHLKKYNFNEGGLLLSQEVEFTKGLPIELAYLGMLPTLREDGNTEITDTFTVNDSKEEYDVSYEDEELGESIVGDKVSIYGENSGVTASMEVLEKRSDIPSEVLVWNAARYNKMYLIYASAGYKTKPGEVWSQKTQYKIKVNN